MTGIGIDRKKTVGITGLRETFGRDGGIGLKNHIGDPLGNLQAQ